MDDGVVMTLGRGCRRGTELTAGSLIGGLGVHASGGQPGPYVKPPRLPNLRGLLIALDEVAYDADVVVDRLATGKPRRVFASLAALNRTVFVVLGIVREHVRPICMEVERRPGLVVRERLCESQDG